MRRRAMQKVRHTKYRRCTNLGEHQAATHVRETGRQGPPQEHMMTDGKSSQPDWRAESAGARLHDERQSAASAFSEVKDDLADKTQDLADDVKQAAGARAESLQSGLGAKFKALGDAMQAAADSLSGNGQTTSSRIAGEVAGGLSRLSASISRKPLGEVVEDVRDFGRQNGTALFATAVLAGLAAGRLFRSADGASANDGDDDRNTTREESRSTSRPSGNTAGSDAAAASSEYDRHVGMGVTR